MSLDLDAARRQTLATSFRPEDLDALLKGRLIMPPHEQWTLPEQPTWQEDPFHDRNWCFQYHTLRWLEPVRRAAAKGDDTAYAMWLHWVFDWVEKNPPEAPRSPWAWADMADGIRALHLCQAAPMVASRSHELIDGLEQAIRTHAEHLADPANIGHANHALHQAESLFVCGRVLQDEGLWRLAADRMSALLLEQYDTQGMNAEGAVAYHHNNVLWWERALSRIDREELPRPQGAERLEMALEGLTHATRPDGTYVTIGDTDRMSPETLDPHPVTDYVRSNGADGSPPDRTTAIYEAGWIFARSGWGDAERPYHDHTYFTVRFGPSKRVHGHADGTSLTYSAHGVNWVVDPGKYDYSASTPRAHVISRAAHSVFSLEGRRVKRDARVDLVRRVIAPTHHDFVLTDSSFGRIAVRRRIIWSASGEYLVVIDEAARARHNRALQRWQLGPDVEAQLDGAQVRLRSGDQRALIAVLSPTVRIAAVRGQTEPFDGWVSTGWRTMTEATAVQVRAEMARPRMVTVLAAGTEADPQARLVSYRLLGPTVLDVFTGAAHERMRITEGDVLIRPITHDASETS
ncbi:heparinase II/III domain-containing protein [Brachybacterium timonense]|uniref:heparinase II/III domain-containing protein n=1 Tax=Brachybacterium timonense TaxID=2050896 RepID=UPI000D0ACA30|nr:heparinase II/III family protein [Brachybacterium timonense]